MNYNEIFHISLLSEVTLKCYTGMEDKIISMKGLCMLVMDAGAGFFDDIQKKQKNHKSDLSMLNFLTCPSVLNLFWINVAASGVGKSVTRQCFILEPLDYIIHNSNNAVPDFKISHFTWPGT